ncbi:hypothetical protein [Lysobacter sp. CA196]|uniref:hypothetical protein n=1 Tax=Lysobacter sp. CA196 TaxID=3455606 RepID=UPI003F8D3FFE
MTYAYLGAEPPGQSAFGSTPADVKLASGFKQWKSDSLTISRANLRRLVNNGTLALEAERWCSGEKREDGWFFSSELDEPADYHASPYFYRFDITGLTQKAWTVLGNYGAPEMHLYLDSDDLDTATKIVVIWLARPRQLLVMSPVGVNLIDLRIGKNPDVWLPLEDYDGA